MVIKKIILLFVIGFLPIISVAQNKGDFIIGPVFGINYATAVGDGIDSLNQQMRGQAELYNIIDGVSISGEISSRTGFNAGFFLDYYFINNIAFCTGLSYSQKGYVVKNSFDLTIGYDYTFDEVRKVNLNYLDFPLLLKYHFNNGIEFSGGLLLSFLESDKVLIESTEIYQTNDSISGNIITITEHTSDREDYNDIVDDNEANALVYGLQLGLSYTIKRLNFSLKFNKNSSFGKIVDMKNNQNINLQFCTGYSF